MINSSNLNYIIWHMLDKFDSLMVFVVRFVIIFVVNCICTCDISFKCFKVCWLFRSSRLINVVVFLWMQVKAIVLYASFRMEQRETWRWEEKQNPNTLCSIRLGKLRHVNTGCSFSAPNLHLLSFTCVRWRLIQN